MRAGVDGNAVVTNLGGLTIGYKNVTAGAASFNSVVITNLGRLYTTNQVMMGYYSSGGTDSNSLTLAQGGKLFILSPSNSVSSLQMGYGAAGNSIGQLVVVRDSGSLLNAGGGVINLGYSAGNATTNGNLGGDVLRIENQGVVTNAGEVRVGQGSVNWHYGCNACLLSVTNGGRLFCQTVWLSSTLGGGYYNTCLVANAGSVLNAGGGGSLLIGDNRAGSGAAAGVDVMKIDDSGLVTNVVSVYVGKQSDNSLTITNGGRLYSTGASAIGDYVSAAFTGNNNRVMVTGSNVLGSASTWYLGGRSLAVGSTGFGATNNSLTIDRGGVVDGIGTLVIGISNQVYLSGGTLGLSNAVVSNTLPFVVGDGIQPATLKALGGTLMFTNGLIITNGATLAGSGVILASTTVFGTNAPGGSAIGAITNNGALTLRPSSSSIFKLAASTTPGIGWDYEVVTNGTLTLGGTLRVQLLGGYIPTNSMSFLIMTNSQPLSGTAFTNVANGKGVAVYTNATDRRAIGTLHVNISSQSVVLSGFYFGYGADFVFTIR